VAFAVESAIELDLARIDRREQTFKRISEAA
jgi:hypothetical protein